MSETAVGLTFMAYLVGMLAIGLLAYRRTRSLSDYLLGGRRLGRWATALSAQASDMSGWLLLGLPGLAYAAGLESLWLAAGLLLGTYLNWRLVAVRLRRYTEIAGDSLTLSDYLERRFGDQTRLLRIVSALFILVFFLFYTTSGLVAGGKLFNTVFDMPYLLAVLVGVAVIVTYTFLGGFLAVAWTDTVQGLMMFGALVAVPLVAISELGGWSTTLDKLERLSPELLDPLLTASGHPLTAIAGLSLMAWGLGYFGQPHILARFMAARSADELPVARRIAVGWTAVTLTGAVLVGLAGFGHLHPSLLDVDQEKVFMRLVELLFHPVLAGIWLAAILAAIMSTADSQLLVASSAVTEDFYKGLLRREASDRELVWIGRLTVIAIALLAMTLATNPESQVLDLVAYAWAGLGAAFGPAILISLYWKRMTRAGALAGMLVGGLTVIVWRAFGGMLEIYEMLPGVLLSVVAIIVVSLSTPMPAAAVREQFDRAVGGAAGGVRGHQAE